MTIELTPNRADARQIGTPNASPSALRFITCGSVDDGKSTLIGRLLVDSKSVLQDQLTGVTRRGEVDLALLTDGLSAEREQGITIDVAYRYFNTASRKFIIGDAPGHQQYTRNMVTAASQADAAVVLIDVTKLEWTHEHTPLLQQTLRHSLLLQLLRVPSIVFAINKLDAVSDARLAFANVRAAVQSFIHKAGIHNASILPISALKGWNVVSDSQTPEGWCGYEGPTLLQILETLPVVLQESESDLTFPVQWVEKFSSSSETAFSRRIFWGRVATGKLTPGTAVRIHPGGQTALIARVLDHTRTANSVGAGMSAGVFLDRELDISRGDWIVAAPNLETSQADDRTGAHWLPTQELEATVAWLSDETLVPGSTYWLLHGHRWVKAKVRRIVQRLNLQSLAHEDAGTLESNDIGHVQLVLQEAIPAASFKQSRTLGSAILVDTATHVTAGALLIR